MPTLATYRRAIDKIPSWQGYGRVAVVRGLNVEIEGAGSLAAVGSVCEIMPNPTFGTRAVQGEVVGFRKNLAIMQPYGQLTGVSEGARVRIDPRPFQLYPHPSWKGRVVNALGQPIDGKGVLTLGNQAYTTQRQAPPAHMRRRLGERLELGIRVMDLFTTCCRGQRLGIFSGSGVGKSLLLSMIAQRTRADITVIGLVGERGRELQEFIHDYLGEDGLSRSIIVVATSDESALLRRQAAWTAMTIAEAMCDEGEEVLYLLDSVTRFAMAQREIGLAAGEPPTSKGYPPSIFSLLPQLLERSGPGLRSTSVAGRIPGNITALASVLVEADDLNEPISDTIRGILDGHIVLSRDIAQSGQYPAVDILKSLSRTVPQCNSDEENALLTEARSLMSTYERMEELIKIGAYQAGSDPKVDRAIAILPNVYRFLHQEPHVVRPSEDFAQLHERLQELLASS